MPHSASSSSFCSSPVSCLGADSGRTTAAGCRSKVTTTVESPAAAARAERSLSSARWPRCTPSYAPIVTAVPALDIATEGSREPVIRPTSTTAGRMRSVPVAS